MTRERLIAFRRTVLEYYQHHGRHDLPWRQFGAARTLDPYRVFVSEIMLQQTQVPRVVSKFEQFTQQFPNFNTLADAPLSEVLKAWNGLGYNRRAKFLWQAAQMVMRDLNGALPRTSAELIKLPGIGPNTAGALVVYAYNQPAVFIETNIRTVFIHHFFEPTAEKIHDKDIVDLVAATLPDNPRQWYWALMDYGTSLKQTIGNLNALSKNYTKQSAFVGSRRQIRGQVLRILASAPKTESQFFQLITDERLPGVLHDLTDEDLIQKTGDYFKLADA